MTLIFALDLSHAPGIAGPFGSCSVCSVPVQLCSVHRCLQRWNGDALPDAGIHGVLQHHL